jgi:hypothetical protein
MNSVSRFSGDMKAECVVQRWEEGVGMRRLTAIREDCFETGEQVK